MSKKSATKRQRPRSRARPVEAARGRGVPWLALGAVAVLVALSAGVLGYALMRNGEVAPFRPSAENPDPSARIPGVVSTPYQGGTHVEPTERVAYDRSPPFGGAHDGYWAACTGTVYPNAVRNENVVHSLEHGAVWITYDPRAVTGADLDALRVRVAGEQYLAMSPYPGLDQPVAVSSWGRQLKTGDPRDLRIEQFIRALRQNPNTHPEVGASCDALGPGAFDPNDPPPLDPSPPGAGAVPVQGSP